MHPRPPLAAVVAIVLSGIAALAHAQEGAIVPTEALAVGRAGRAGRAPVFTDAVVQTIVDGTFAAPREGAAIALPGGERRTWERIEAGDDGWFQHRGWAAVTVELDAAAVMRMHARGHSAVYVNGRPRYGDPYDAGFVRLPVALRRGKNLLLFNVGRGRFRVSLDPIATPIGFNPDDRTTPNAVIGEPIEALCGVVVYNATNKPARRLAVRASNSALGDTVTPIPTIPPMSVRKVPVTVNGPAPRTPESYDVRLELIDRDSRRNVLATSTLRIEAVPANALLSRTFESAIDGSVQYYAVRAATTGATTEAPGMVLSLHGAGVQARGQANCYRPRDWGHIVAPTNRRPFGFDWEDWGRLDALEVLAEARRLYRSDERRTWVTGHSMGGHGAWHLGLTFPGTFAAVAPSAGWVSFWSYTGAAEPSGGSIEVILHRATAPSRTLALLPNTRTQGIYVLHGDRDDNVPVEQARTMRREQLGAFHPDFTYYERPGAGHWWGNACVDWSPLMEFLARRARPALKDVVEVAFVTADPGVSSDMDWVRVQQQIVIREPSSIEVRFDRVDRSFSGSTTNVRMLGIDVGALADGPAPAIEMRDERTAAPFKAGAPLVVDLDGQRLADVPWPPRGDRLWLRRSDGGAWSAGSPPSADEKTPGRCGPFKAAFRNRMMLVYGTQGSPAENAWARDKACFDAETFWYRGNGSIDIVADVDFKARAHPDRNIVLYGNSTTNDAWGDLIEPCGIEVTAGRVVVGGETMQGDGLAVLFVRPRAGSNVASVAVVGGSGLRGMRVTDRLPYFVSGVAYPDLTVIGSDMPTRGMDAVRAAGFFGPDWSIERGDFAFSQ